MKSRLWPGTRGRSRYSAPRFPWVRKLPRSHPSRTSLTKRCWRSWTCWGSRPLPFATMAHSSVEFPSILPEQSRPNPKSPHSSRIPILSSEKRSSTNYSIPPLTRITSRINGTWCCGTKSGATISWHRLTASTSGSGPVFMRTSRMTSLCEKS